MWINRKQKGFGWYSKVVSKDLNSNAERVGYIDFSFKKDCEPDNLNEKGSYEGDLYFIDKDNRIRKVFPVVKEYNGKTSIEFKLLDWQFRTEEQQIAQDNSNFGGSKSNSADNIVSADDLPFY